MSVSALANDLSSNESTNVCPKTVDLVVELNVEAMGVCLFFSFPLACFWCRLLSPGL